MLKDTVTKIVTILIPSYCVSSSACVQNPLIELKQVPLVKAIVSNCTYYLYFLFLILWQFHMLL